MLILVSRLAVIRNIHEETCKHDERTYHLHNRLTDTMYFINFYFTFARNTILYTITHDGSMGLAYLRYMNG